MGSDNETLRLKWLGIDTYKEAIIYVREDNPVCHAEGFDIPSRIRVKVKDKSILATLNTIDSNIIKPNEVSLSKYAWEMLDAKEGDKIILIHPKPLLSLSYVRKKIYGNTLSSCEIHAIVKDISLGRYSDIHLATFLASCAGGHLSPHEIIEFTKAMIDVGDKLTWNNNMVVDKHCIGGLPGNRTTPIVVPIVAAYGLLMPKTSSRAITSPAGTADTMEVLAPVDLSLEKMHKVVEKENGCIVWGGAVSLSPTDDVLIRVERAMDLDSEGQLVASVLSKKVAAGSKYVVIDIPIGPTAKVRSMSSAESLKKLFISVAKALDIEIKVIFSDGSQPIGRGIGPVLEALDVLSVLQLSKDAPQDLRNRSLILASKIIEFSPNVNEGEGLKIATEILDSGKAWKKFQAICDAQGGMREPKKAKYTHEITAPCKGKIVNIDNRRLAKLAKLAGAPFDKSAGVEIFAPLDSIVEKDQPLLVLHAQTTCAIKLALSLLDKNYHIVEVEPFE